MASDRPVMIYISAASDLMAERELLARTIATLPVTLAWRIVQSPIGEETFEPGLVDEADLHILIIGGDIRAPIGLELYTAQALNQLPIGFLKRGIARTTAGDIFVKQSRLQWHTFSDPADLGQQVRRLIINHLIRHAIKYTLTPPEIEHLQALQQQADSPESPAGQNKAEAGRSAVILSRKRFSPKEGVLVDDS